MGKKLSKGFKDSKDPKVEGEDMFVCPTKEDIEKLKEETKRLERLEAHWKEVL